MARLYGETRASLEYPTLEHLPAALAPHPRTETVNSHPAAFLWLICSFHNLLSRETSGVAAAISEEGPSSQMSLTWPVYGRRHACKNCSIALHPVHMASNSVRIHVSLVEVGVERFGIAKEVGHFRVACLNGQVLGDLSHVRVGVVTPVSLRGCRFQELMDGAPCLFRRLKQISFLKFLLRMFQELAARISECLREFRTGHERPNHLASPGALSIWEPGSCKGRLILMTNVLDYTRRSKFVSIYSRSFISVLAIILPMRTL